MTWVLGMTFLTIVVPVAILAAIYEKLKNN